MKYPEPGSPESPVAVQDRYDNYIGGKWVAPVNGRYLENVSPVTGRPFCEVARSDAADVELALDAAHQARESWGRTSATERANILLKIADRMEANLQDLAVLETWDNGKPVRETLAADMPLAIDHFRYFAGVLRAQEGTISQIDEDTVAYHFHEPLGVVGQIIPWNFPILMATWKLAPGPRGRQLRRAQACRTDAVVDPQARRAGRRPPARRGAQRRQRLRRRGRQAAASSPRVGKVAFTGETTTGRLIMQYAVGEPDPRDAGARRQEPQHLLRRRRWPPTTTSATRRSRAS